MHDSILIISVCLNSDTKMFYLWMSKKSNLVLIYS